jgi:hypothetical protein
MSAILETAVGERRATSWLSTDHDGDRDEFRTAFADFLVAQNITDRSTLDRAGSAARKTGERLDRVLTKLGLLSESDLAAALSKFLNIPLVAAADIGWSRCSKT